MRVVANYAAPHNTADPVELQLDQPHDTLEENLHSCGIHCPVTQATMIARITAGERVQVTSDDGVWVFWRIEG